MPRKYITPIPNIYSMGVNIVENQFETIGIYFANQVFSGVFTVEADQVV